MTTDYETSLIGRIQAGDRNAEAELFTRFGERIGAIVRKRIGADTDDWKDVTSEVFVAVLVNLREGRFDAQKGALGTYFYGIAANKLKDYFKMKKKQSAMLTAPLDDDDIAMQDRAEVDLEQQELQDLVRNHLARLKVKYKEALYLRYFEGLSVSEISERLNLPPKRVSERINYALKLLRKECEKSQIFSIFPGFFLILI